MVVFGYAKIDSTDKLADYVFCLNTLNRLIENFFQQQSFLL